MSTTAPITVTIPVFPCKAIDEQLDFYKALGFEVTYQQSKPNLYACVRHSFTELHFFVLKSLNPAEPYSMCYISVPNVDELYQQLIDSLKKTYGKTPTKGLPRISKVNNLTEDRRFNIVDPAGNRLMIGQRHTASALQEEYVVYNPDSNFAQVYKSAYRLAYAKEDPQAAARILDIAFAKKEPVTTVLRLNALVLRADVAIEMDDLSLAQLYLAEARQLSLTEEDHQEAATALLRAEELEQLFH